MYQKAEKSDQIKRLAKKNRKKKCPKCAGKGCSHCSGKGYHK